MEAAEPIIVPSTVPPAIVEEAIQQEAPQSLFKVRSSKKSKFRKRPATPPPEDSSSSSDYTSSEDEATGHRIKRRRKTAGVTATSTTAAKPTTTDLSAPSISANLTTTIASANDATKQSNWFDETSTSTSTPSLSDRQLLGTTRVPPPSGGDGAYHGTSGYQSFIQKNPNAPSKPIGPIKAPTNIRTITVTDFAPDVCKDYKQTGFCGFGDSCKFLHAREDYKQGWQLDREWENVSKGKKMGGRTVASRNRTEGAGDGDGDEEDEEKLLEGIPFACIVCKKAYANPVVTRCGHYFCEACALGRYRRNPNCAACGAGTGGVFNGAKNLRRLLEKKRERERVRKEKARENGEEVSEEEDSGGEDEGE